MPRPYFRAAGIRKKSPVLSGHGITQTKGVLHVGQQKVRDSLMLSRPWASVGTGEEGLGCVIFRN